MLEKDESIEQIAERPNRQKKTKRKKIKRKKSWKRSAWGKVSSTKIWWRQTAWNPEDCFDKHFNKRLKKTVANNFEKINRK